MRKWLHHKHPHQSSSLRLRGEEKAREFKKRGQSMSVGDEEDLELLEDDLHHSPVAGGRPKLGLGLEHLGLRRNEQGEEEEEAVEIPTEQTGVQTPI